MGDDGAIQPVHPDGLDITLVVVSEVETLVDPIIRQSLWIIQICAEEQGRADNVIIREKVPNNKIIKKMWK